MNNEELLIAVTESLPQGFKLEYELSRQDEPVDGYARLITPDGISVSFVLELKKSIAEKA